jgi:hypothetical protein
MKVELEGVANFHEDDGGQALIAEVETSEFANDDEGFFVRLHSWSERHVHEVAEKLQGKRVRVTVEVIE